MIALALQDCFLPQLDSVFFLQLTNHTFEELQLILFLVYFSIDLYDNFLFDSFFVETVACHLREKLEGLHTPPEVALLVELVGVLQLALLSVHETHVLSVIMENVVLQSFEPPLVDPTFDHAFQSFVLQKLTPKNLLTFLSSFLAL